MMDKVDRKIVNAGGQPKTEQDKIHLIIEKMDLLGDKYRDVSKALSMEEDKTLDDVLSGSYVPEYDVGRTIWLQASNGNDI